MIARGFGTAAVLMLLVLLLFVIARIIGGQTLEVVEKRRARLIRIGAVLQPLATRGYAFVEPTVARAKASIDRWFADREVRLANEALPDREVAAALAVASVQSPEPTTAPPAEQRLNVDVDPQTESFELDDDELDEFEEEFAGDDTVADDTDTTASDSEDKR